MPRPRTGSIDPHGDHFDARIRLPDGRRAPRICLAAGLTPEQAKAEAAELQRVLDEEHAKASSAPTPAPSTSAGDALAPADAPAPSPSTPAATAPASAPATLAPAVAASAPVIAPNAAAPAVATTVPETLPAATGAPVATAPTSAPAATTTINAPAPTPDTPRGELVESWVQRWFAHREAAGLSSVEADRPRWKKWVAPHLNKLVMATVSKEDIENLVESLDNAMHDKKLSWKTALNAWAIVNKAFSDSCNGKVRSLRVRKDDPTDGVRGPDRGATRAKAVFFPAEVVRFLASPRVSIPMRQMMAIAVYTGMRPGELRALRWIDVDLENGTILVHEQIDRDGQRRNTKTKRTRRIPIEPNLMPLLRVMHREVGGRGPVVTYPIRKDSPRFLRAALIRAGIARKELHVKGRDRSRVAVRVHDTRGTFATWLGARGEPVWKVMAICGHENLQTTQGYVQQGELLRDALKDVFPALPPELLSESDTTTPAPMAPRASRTAKAKTAPPHQHGTASAPEGATAPPSDAAAAPAEETSAATLAAPAMPAPVASLQSAPSNAPAVPAPVASVPAAPAPAASAWHAPCVDPLGRTGATSPSFTETALPNTGNPPIPVILVTSDARPGLAHLAHRAQGIAQTGAKSLKSLWVDRDSKPVKTRAFYLVL